LAIALQPSVASIPAGGYLHVWGQRKTLNVQEWSITILLCLNALAELVEKAQGILFTHHFLVVDQCKQLHRVVQVLEND
jgi:hypothetical protein